MFIIVVNSNPSPIFISPPKTNNKVEETPGAFEGDIILPPQSLLRGLTRIGSSVQWPDGIVPYEIMPGYQAEQEAIIIGAMRKIESLTAINNVRCIQFRPRDVSDLYYTIIQDGTGYSSPVGRQTNAGVFINGTVTLQYPGCIDVGRIMHELFHTLGFYHEQSRPDRDNYLVIYPDTIQTGMSHNFLKYDNTAADTLNSSYDYSSIMHYERTAFSKNGSFTIEPLQPNTKIGQRYKLTSTDIQHIHLFYNCTSVGTILPSTTTATTTTISSSINKQYNSELTMGSPTYTRMNGFGTNYYYEQIEVTVSIAGVYTFKCTSVIDTFATIYGGSYNASSDRLKPPILVVDDESDDNWEFSFAINFGYPGIITVLVTAYSPGVTGAYTIDASGPSNVNFVQIILVPQPPLQLIPVLVPQHSLQLIPVPAPQHPPQRIPVPAPQLPLQLIQVPQLPLQLIQVPQLPLQLIQVPQLPLQLIPAPQLPLQPIPARQQL
ncbi:unnamed protein product [Rotaria magnacalcarata]|uniref:Metalloendopeptidase n=1 Tax=Rotaria magnacalcarata TaxID=392030 RepID=A0A815ZA55_9BILA|nr:unnamed protein product [Rotaria magnacalcarata]